MKNPLDIYKAHMAAQDVAENALLAYHLTSHSQGASEYRIREVRKYLEELAGHLGCTITWPADEAADNAAVELSRKLEAEDADHADTVAELQEMIHA